MGQKYCHRDLKLDNAIYLGGKYCLIDCAHSARPCDVVSPQGTDGRQLMMDEVRNERRMLRALEENYTPPTRIISKIEKDRRQIEFFEGGPFGLDLT